MGVTKAAQLELLEGLLQLLALTAVGMAGVLIGDGLMFTLGRVYGQRVQTLPGLREQVAESLRDLDEVLAKLEDEQG